MQSFIKINFLLGFLERWYKSEHILSFIVISKYLRLCLPNILIFHLYHYSLYYSLFSHGNQNVLCTTQCSITLFLSESFRLLIINKNSLLFRLAFKSRQHGPHLFCFSPNHIFITREAPAPPAWFWSLILPLAHRGYFCDILLLDIGP